MTMVFAALAGGVVLGTVFQRVTGMGFALLMAPFFAIVFGPYEGILLMNLGGAVSSLLMLSRVWRDVDWGRFLMLSSAAIPSGIIAGLVITRLDQPTLQILVGVVLILGLSASLFLRPAPARSSPSGLAFAAGAVSGFTNAAAGIGGPPVGIYAQATGWPQRNLAATLQPVFFVISVSAFASKTIISGGLPGLAWWIYPSMVLFIVVGLTVGELSKKWIDDRLARLAVIVFCYFGAASAIVDGVIAMVQGTLL